MVPRKREKQTPAITSGWTGYTGPKKGDDGCEASGGYTVNAPTEGHFQRHEALLVGMAVF